MGFPALIFNSLQTRMSRCSPAKQQFTSPASQELTTAPEHLPMGTPFAFAVLFSGLALNSTWWRGASSDRPTDSQLVRHLFNALSIAAWAASDTERTPLNLRSIYAMFMQEIAFSSFKRKT